MLRWSPSLLSFSDLAARAALHFTQSTQPQRDAIKSEKNKIKTEASIQTEAINNKINNPINNKINNPIDTSCVPYIDDQLPSQLAAQMHIESPAYQALHSRALSHSSMGLFGGELGFEKAYRVWVDPERPHMKHLYNQTALAKNLRYSRYGYFKRDMHLLDVGKLIRHARMLPTPNRLLTDFIYQRVPLGDESCREFIFYQREQIEMVEEYKKEASFEQAEEMFERMLVTNLPPVEVGVGTHAEMILCAASCKKWERGWDIYAQRAREMEQENPNEFKLNTAFYDAVMALCVACERPKEGLAILAELIQRHLRPRGEILDKALILCSIQMEQWYQHKSGEAGHFVSAEQEQEWIAQGPDIWSLYEFYALPRTAASFVAYMRMCSIQNQPLLALEALNLADSLHISIPLECFYWIFYALREVPNFGDYILDVFSQLGSRGLTPDFILFTVAFMYCAIHKDGELAVALFTQFFQHQDINPTPELILLFLQSCAGSNAPTTEMLSCSQILIERLEHVGSVEDRLSEIYDQFLELCAHLGAITTAFSRLKKLVSYGKVPTTRQLNSVLLANANASPPTGSSSMTEEILNIFKLLQLSPSEDTHICLRLCMEKFGSDPTSEAFEERIMNLKAQQESQTGDSSLHFDEDIPILQDPPHKLRSLKTKWNLRPRDMILQRYGQTHKIPGKAEANIGSQVGSIVPFGRRAGEKRV